MISDPQARVSSRCIRVDLGPGETGMGCEAPTTVQGAWTGTLLCVGSRLGTSQRAFVSGRVQLHVARPVVPSSSPELAGSRQTSSMAETPFATGPATPHQPSCPPSVQNWLQAVNNSNAANLGDVPNYWIPNTQTLVTTSEPVSFSIGNGLQLLSSSVIPQCLNAKHELLIVTCFW